MNTKKRIITTAITIFCYSFCHAQQAHYSPSRELALHQNSIKTTKYVFEGAVTQQQCYYGKNKEILTCSVIQITKIYKGSPQLKLGSIKVITKQGGQIGNNHSQKVLDDRGVALSKGSIYIIFGRQASSYMLADTMIATDNNITLTTMDCDNPVVFFTNNTARWGYTSYKTTDSLYSFFKANGLTVQEEAEEKK